MIDYKLQKRFKRLKRIQEEESEDEQVQEIEEERDAIANELFSNELGSGDVSFLKINLFLYYFCGCSIIHFTIVLFVVTMLSLLGKGRISGMFFSFDVIKLVNMNKYHTFLANYNFKLLKILI